MTRYRIYVASLEDRDEEYARVQAFYEKNRSNGNRIRDPEELLKAVSDNKAYIIEHCDTRDIVGVSVCFSIGNGQYTESGGTRIILNGYGMQKIFNYIKAMHEFIFDEPIFGYYAIVADWNDKSYRSLLSVGFKEWSPEQRLLDLIGLPKEGKTFYLLEKVQLPAIRDKLLNLCENPILTHREDKSQIEIDFDLDFIKFGWLTRETEF